QSRCPLRRSLLAIGSLFLFCVAEPQANNRSHPPAAPTTSVLGFFLAMQLSRSVTSFRGGERARTADFLRAKQVLYKLSYTPGTRFVYSRARLVRRLHIDGPSWN